MPREDCHPTGKCSCHKDGRKTTNPANKRRVADKPIMATDIMMVSVSPTIDRNSEYYEDLEENICLSTCLG